MAESTNCPPIRKPGRRRNEFGKGFGRTNNWGIAMAPRLVDPGFCTEELPGIGGVAATIRMLRAEMTMRTKRVDDLNITDTYCFVSWKVPCTSPPHTAPP